MKRLLPGAVWICATGLLLLLLPGVQLFLIVESHTIDTGQHLVFLVVLPVCAGLLGDLEGLQRLGVGQVWLKSHPDQAVEIRFDGEIHENWDNGFHYIQHTNYNSVMVR